jgi:hypothetical protein
MKGKETFATPAHSRYADYPTPSTTPGGGTLTEGAHSHSPIPFSFGSALTDAEISSSASAFSADTFSNTVQSQYNGLGVNTMDSNSALVNQYSRPANNKAEEALRILEGLKHRNMSYKYPNATGAEQDARFGRVVGRAEVQSPR